MCFIASHLSPILGHQDILRFLLDVIDLFPSIQCLLASCLFWVQFQCLDELHNLLLLLLVRCRVMVKDKEFGFVIGINEVLMISMISYHDPLSVKFNGENIKVFG